jgi:hypothetical protein
MEIVGFHSAFYLLASGYQLSARPGGEEKTVRLTVVSWFKDAAKDSRVAVLSLYLPPRHTCLLELRSHHNTLRSTPKTLGRRAKARKISL